MIGEWGPAPLVLPYIMHAAVVVFAVVVAFGVAETLVSRMVGDDVVRLPAVRPGQGRRTLRVVAPLAVCVYAFLAGAIGGVPVLIGLPAAPVALTGLLAGRRHPRRALLPLPCRAA